MAEKEIGNGELGNGDAGRETRDVAFEACYDLLGKLVKIENIVNAAMQNQPEDAEDNSIHLLEALEKIADLCPPRDTYHTPKEAADFVTANPPFDPAAGTGALPEVPKADLKGLVGIRANKQHILAWSYTDSLDVRVTADETAPNEWDVFVSSNNMTRLQGCILGGRWLAMSLCKHLRNGMVSRRMKKRRLTANRQARKAAQKGEA